MNQQDIRNYLIKLLARRDYARAELLNKLMAKGFPQDLGEKVLNDIEAQGWLNEKRYAENCTRGCIAKGYGPLHIKAKLSLQKIATETIEEILNDYSYKYWENLAWKIKTKKFGESKPCSQKETIRQVRFLINRGFTLEQIKKAISSSKIICF